MSETKKYICDCGEIYSSLAAIESCQSHHNHNKPDLAAINTELVAALEGFITKFVDNEPCFCPVFDMFHAHIQKCRVARAALAKAGVK